MVDILDLSSFAPETTNFTVTIERDATCDNTVDFYEVDAEGNVVDADGNTIAPGETGYAEAAIANRLELDLSTENGVVSQFDVEFEAGKFYAPVIAIESDFEAFSDEDSSNDPTVYFSDAAANVDGFDHVISEAGNVFGFEDMPGGGDEDFNDIIVSLEPVVEEPVVEEPVIEEPVIEEPVIEIREGSISGLNFNDLNSNAVRDSELIQGADPDVVFVVDVSGSTFGTAIGTSVGNPNGDERENSILDAEIAGFTALNQQLIDRGLENIDIGVVSFSNEAQTLITTTPGADDDENGNPDVEDALNALDDLFGTNYESGLAEAQNIFASFGTEFGEGNLVFLSDGEPNVLNYDDEVVSLNDLGVNLSAFGAGEGAVLEPLQIIDPDAQISNFK